MVLSVKKLKLKLSLDVAVSFLKSEMQIGSANTEPAGGDISFSFSSSSLCRRIFQATDCVFRRKKPCEHCFSPVHSAKQPKLWHGLFAPTYFLFVQSECNIPRPFLQQRFRRCRKGCMRNQSPMFGIRDL